MLIIKPLSYECRIISVSVLLLNLPPVFKEIMTLNDLPPSRCCQYHRLYSGDEWRTEWDLTGGGRGLVVLETWALAWKDWISPRWGQVNLVARWTLETMWSRLEI